MPCAVCHVGQYIDNTAFNIGIRSIYGITHTFSMWVAVSRIVVNWDPPCTEDKDLASEPSVVIKFLCTMLLFYVLCCCFMYFPVVLCTMLLFYACSHRCHSKNNVSKTIIPLRGVTIIIQPILCL
jgi:hypothetical protein